MHLWSFEIIKFTTNVNGFENTIIDYIIYVTAWKLLMGLRSEHEEKVVKENS